MLPYLPRNNDSHFWIFSRITSLPSRAVLVHPFFKKMRKRFAAECAAAPRMTLLRSKKVRAFIRDAVSFPLSGGVAATRDWEKSRLRDRSALSQLGQAVAFHHTASQTSAAKQPQQASPVLQRPQPLVPKANRARFISRVSPCWWPCQCRQRVPKPCLHVVATHAAHPTFPKPALNAKPRETIRRGRISRAPAMNLTSAQAVSPLCRWLRNR